MLGKWQGGCRTLLHAAPPELQRDEDHGRPKEDEVVTARDGRQDEREGARPPEERELAPDARGAPREEHEEHEEDQAHPVQRPADPRRVHRRLFPLVVRVLSPT